MSTSKRMRCAIYTRTSSDEHLDQEFNSLHAQREACEAYVHSQSGEGWHLLSQNYEDGGFSGGTMERPGLRQLLEQIRKSQIEVIVVYKIDRLTRSLMDFARIVEILDDHQVSFVSVTQAFNTTTSMGRLTLNVLLSFAQFEREVTAERIRDKISASKKKGMWMGGTVPLGYRVANRKLLIEKAEADTVRHIFHRYLEVKSIRRLAEEINQSSLCIRRGRPRNGLNYITAPFGPGNLRYLLANPVYVGKIRHHQQIYEGEQDGIIDPDLFERVQTQLKSRAPKRRHPKNATDVHLLTGILFDETGDRLSPTHAKKRDVRYRYYVSKRIVDKGRDPNDQYTGWRIRASDIEALVENQLQQVLLDQQQLIKWADDHLSGKQIQQLAVAALSKSKEWPTTTHEEKQIGLKLLFRRITVHPGWVHFELDQLALLAWIMGKTLNSENDSPVLLKQPTTFRRRGVENRMVLANGTDPAPQPDHALIDLIVRANRYLAELTDGSSKSLSQVAEAHGTDMSEVSRLLPFAFLSPRLVESILTGTQPVGLGAHRLSRTSGLPFDWSRQAERLGF